MNTDHLILEMWVVYDHPRDLPDHIVVRRQAVRGDGTIVHDPRAYGFTDLNRARAWLREMALTPVQRSPDDDPTIIECWL